jgi:hypothetical protein
VRLTQGDQEHGRHQHDGGSYFAEDATQSPRQQVTGRAVQRGHVARGRNDGEERVQQHRGRDRLQREAPHGCFRVTRECDTQRDQDDGNQPPEDGAEGKCDQPGEHRSERAGEIGDLADRRAG